MAEVKAFELYAIAYNVEIGTNGIFFSKNNGVFWEKVSDEGFYSIRIADKNNAWLSGNEVVAKMTIY